MQGSSQRSIIVDVTFVATQPKTICRATFQGGDIGVSGNETHKPPICNVACRNMPGGLKLTFLGIATLRLYRRIEKGLKLLGYVSAQRRLLSFFPS
jgi:hypothetical protein